MSVQDLMTEAPRTVLAQDTLATAAERMWVADCGALPVVNEDGAVVAMITDRDICMASWSRGQPPAALRVEAAMSRTLVACRPGDPLEIAEGAMRTAQVRRLPVVDEAQRLVGIISLADIAVAGERGQRSKTTNGLSTTLAIICEKPLVRASSTDEARSAAAAGDAALDPAGTTDGRAA